MSIAVDISKKFENFSLNISFKSDAKRIGILGASGCGKSMTLKSIAGIEKPDSGKIEINGNVLYDSEHHIFLKPQKRNVGYMFQNYALFPTMTVRQNITAALKMKKDAKEAIADQLLLRYGISSVEDKLPSQISGGQQQRTAFARIMAVSPEVILLDEPFSALDGYMKDKLQAELSGFMDEYQGTVILVSHNRDEIFRLTDEVIVMDNGRNIISGDTKKIFNEPVYKESARLTGCKNFSDLLRTGDRTCILTDWGIALSLEHEIPQECDCMGYRAHDFIPLWSETKEPNSIKINIAYEAKLPFEEKYYLWPENKEQQIEKETEKISWFVQRDLIREIEEKGMPNYLKLDENKIMWLKKGNKEV